MGFFMRAMIQRAPIHLPSMILPMIADSVFA